MKRVKNLVRLLLLVLLVFLLNVTLNAQEPYAKLEKNKNILAKNLIHERIKLRGIGSRKSMVNTNL